MNILNSIKEIQKLKHIAVHNQQYEKAARLHDEERQLKERYKNLHIERAAKIDQILS